MDDRIGSIGFLSRLLQSTDVWMGVAYLAAMFAVAGFRPQHIANRALFRLSFIVFGVALAVPPLVEGFVTLLLLDRPTTPRLGAGPDAMQIVSLLFHFFATIVFAIAVVLGLASLQLGPGRQDVPRVAPAERD